MKRFLILLIALPALCFGQNVTTTTGTVKEGTTYKDESPCFSMHFETPEIPETSLATLQEKQKNWQSEMEANKHSLSEEESVSDNT